MSYQKEVRIKQSNTQYCFTLISLGKETEKNYQVIFEIRDFNDKIIERNYLDREVLEAIVWELTSIAKEINDISPKFKKDAL